jgi:hypothetical protein
MLGVNSLSGPSNDWGDADAWRKALVERMRRRAEIYELEPDPLLRRNKAIAMVGDISAFLKDLPGVQNSDLFPLKDLMIFSEDLDHGRSHPWAQPVNVGGTNYESVAQTEIRQWVILTSLTLIESGYGAKEADQKITALLAASGREVAWRTVQRWRLAFKRGDDPRLARVQQRYDEFWNNLGCAHGALQRACPASGGGRCTAFTPRQIAEEFAKWAFTLPKFRDWFIS